MLYALPAPLHGAIVSLFFVGNLLFWAVPVYVVIVFKLIPIRPLQGLCTDLLHWLCQRWQAGNTLFAETLNDTRWHLHQEVALNQSQRYVVVSNHQTWNDIYVLMRVLGHQVPFFKFFLKQQLIWVPILGPVWWALDYPFMKRYSRAQIRENPELAGKDLETARASCAKYRRQPVTVLNFVEGTRFTPAKQEAQSSPYTHLLRPKTGGLALAVAALGDLTDKLIDVTIVYHGGAVGFWDFMCGRMREVSVEVRELPVPAGWRTGDYAGDRDFRAEAQSWMARLWEDKDARIAWMLAHPGATPPADCAGGDAPIREPATPASPEAAAG